MGDGYFGFIFACFLFGVLCQGVCLMESFFCTCFYLVFMDYRVLIAYARGAVVVITCARARRANDSSRCECDDLYFTFDRLPRGGLWVV